MRSLKSPVDEGGLPGAVIVIRDETRLDILERELTFRKNFSMRIRSPRRVAGATEPDRMPRMKEGSRVL